MRVTHLAFDFGAGHECGHRVDDDEVDRARANEHVGDFECLLTRVGLRDEKRVNVDTELLGVLGVESVLRIDEGSDATGALHIGNRVKRERGLSRRFWTVDFADTATWEPANAERNIECDRPSGDHLNGSAFIRTEAHDGTLTELSVDLGEGCFECFFAVSGGCHGRLLFLL